jgi:hypothetical protein
MMHTQTAAHVVPLPSFGTLGARRESIIADYGAILRDLAQPWSDLYSAWADTLRPAFGTGKSAQHGCRCPRCEADDCHCRCCVTNADLLVRGRVGERRVVPLVIENNWRREREIELQLSSWSPTGGDAKVTGELLPPDKFVLRACEERSVILLVNVEAGEQPGGAEQQGERTLPDVRDCLVSYADLRIIGCDLRAVRIAVAVLSRDCEAMRIDCRCACC